MKVDVQIKNKKALFDFIEYLKYIKSTKPLSDTKKELNEDLVNKIRNNFEKGQEANGRSWKPLKYRKGDPLLLTRKLFNSIKSKNTKTGVSVYTSVKYAAFQNFGTDNVPARRFIPNANEVPEKWLDDFKNIALKHYKKD